MGLTGLMQENSVLALTAPMAMNGRSLILTLTLWIRRFLGIRGVCEDFVVCYLFLAGCRVDRVGSSDVGVDLLFSFHVCVCAVYSFL